ncbi:major capsid protein [Asticcacaulis sp.]|uniref:major capsid protein n=1 Tax=Asticcacaulis sp. TaxID=1872648 RepID=UPI0031D62C41
MATLAITHPTLADIRAAMDPNGQIAQVIEMLGQTNEILDDMVWLEANDGSGHKTTIRTGLPTPTWRKLYGGVQPTKGRRAQVRDTCGMMEDYAEVDAALADMNGNTAAFRLSEDAAHIEGFNQELASSLFYANEATAPEEITGFAPRFNSLSADNADSIIQEGVVDGNDNASIWLVVWGPQTCHGIYPKGSQAGLQVNDKGQVTLENVDGNGGRMEAYRTHYRWDAGLCVRDWRYVIRGQYNQEDLTFDASSGPNLPKLLTQMIERVPSLNMGRPAIYMNRKAREALRTQITEKVKNSTLTVETIAGKRVLTFDGVPVRRVDQLLNTEATIS